MRSLTLLIVALIFTACSSRDPSAPRDHFFFDALFSDSYSETFDAHTLREVVLSEFEPVMTVFATNWTEKMSEAYVTEMSRQFRYQKTATEKLIAEQKAENDKFYVFVLSASTREPEWNEFERKTSMWRITLESHDGSIQADPERVEAVSQKDEKAKYFYQRMSSFNRTYRVRFLKEDLKGASKLKLHISGPRGNVTFIW